LGTLAYTKNCLYIVLDARYIDKTEKIDEKKIKKLLKVKKIKIINLK
jgi:hypothetical protein